jgi:hypothetical protein
MDVWMSVFKESFMNRSLLRLLFSAVALASLMSTFAYAQSGSASAPLSGVVTDKDGGVMPGVTVVVKNNSTSASLAPVVTNSAGVFLVAALDPGTYTVTASLQGFKTVVITDVKMITATPTNLKVTLEVGQLTETVNVAAHADIVQTQSTAITSTITSDQMANLPLITKNALNFVTFLPGVDTGGTHSQRASSVAGLPQVAIGITIDGVNSQDNYNKTGDGFFSIITPNTEAIEEVTVTSATQGADSSGQGAVQIKFTTKSGTNQYRGSFYETWRDPVMNENTFFNKVNGLPVNKIKLNQFGGNVGGPIQLPGYNGRGRAFFFADYEEFRQPSEITRNRVVMSAGPRSGVFTYSNGGVNQSVNILALAAANGQISVADPVIGKLLNDIATATASSGSLTPNTDPNTASYSWNSPSSQARHFPTQKLDFNLTQANKLSVVYTFQKFNSNPDTLNNVDPKFPGFPNHGSQFSYRNSGTATLRSTLTSNLVNEGTYGIVWAPVNFFSDIGLGQFANQGGYSLSLRGGTAFANVSLATAGAETSSAAGANGVNPESRNGWDWNLNDKVTWQKGRHSLQFGEEFTVVKAWIKDQQPAQSVNFGVDTTNDPANVMFNTTNFPGASTTNLADARFLYGLLTGRVTSIQGQLALTPDGYVYGGVAERRTKMPELGLFVQDAWRVRPNLTLNYGLRYELQWPLQPENSVYSMNTVQDACGLSGQGNGVGGRPCNIFAPGTLTGTSPVYRQYSAGSPGYKTDYNNLGPSVGVAWLPNVQGGFLRSILGDPNQATVRAGYARAFNREGLGAMGGVYDSNPGVFVQQTRSVGNGNLVFPGETFPLLLSQTSRMGPDVFALKPTYPIPVTAANRGSGVNMFDPSWEISYADSYSLGFQRSVSKDMAVEVRYIGTRGKKIREAENWNEVNIVENGFLNEFKLAQANLYSNIAAGRGQTIAYFGAGTGTSPLPTYLAYFNASRDAGNAAAYSGANWTNTTIVGRFASLNPNPGGSAGTDLQGTAANRTNALAAGIASNFFVMNPDTGSVNVQESKRYTQYDALQIEMRRRLSQGLTLGANYTYATRLISRLDSLRVNRYLVQDTNGVPHALKLTGSYDIPFGHGKRFGADINPWADGFAGGWSVNVTGKVTSGQVLNFGNVNLVGMTLADLQSAIKYRIVPKVVNADGTVTPVKVYNMPQDIIDNTVKAFSTNVLGYTAGAPTGRYLAPANGPNCIQVVRGDCAPKDLFVVAPIFTRFDFSARKQIRTGGKTALVVEFDVLNLFNAIDFNPTISTSTTADNYRVTSSYSDVNGTFDPGSRVGQLLLRFNW